MTLALRSPEMVSSIVAVDNAPVDVALNGDFSKYVRGMQKIQDAKVSRQAEADAILQSFEEVRHQIVCFLNDQKIFFLC